MHCIRIAVACAAILLSFLCFVGAEVRVQEPHILTTTEYSAETAEAVMEAVGEGRLPVPLAGRRLAAEVAVPTTAADAAYEACTEVTELAADEYYVYDDGAAQMNFDYRAGLAMELQVIRHKQHAALLQLVKERIRREEEQAAEQRRLAEQQVAEEAAKRAACPGYDDAFVKGLTAEEQAEAQYFYEQGFVYYRQNWSVLDDQYYGNEGFGLCGCGPTCIAAIISNLAGVPVDPEEMRVYGLSVGSWVPSGGTSYGFLIETAKKYGIEATQIYSSDKEALFDALRDENKLVLATMGPGDFTYGAHFMLFRGITDEGKILISDSYSFEFSTMEWDYDYLYAQLKSGYWIFEKTN